MLGAVYLPEVPTRRTGLEGRDTARRPRQLAGKAGGAEWRKIARLPAGRIVALRVQVILV